MDKNRFIALALSAALVGGCASTTDYTRHDGALTGAGKGLGFAAGVGHSVGEDDPVGGFLFTLVSAPFLMLGGAAIGALTANKSAP